MNEINITLNIQAPELVQAINNLASALAGKIALGVTNEPPKAPVVPPQNPAPATVVQMPVTQTPASAPVGAPTAVPTAIQSYTVEQLAVAATQLVDAGRREDLVQLLGQFGVQALTALPKEHYGAFATSLRQMGAKI